MPCTYEDWMNRASQAGGLDTAPLAWSCWSNAFAYGELLVDGELAHGDLFLQPLYQRGAAGAVQTIVARFQGISRRRVPRLGSGGPAYLSYYSACQRS